MGWARDAALAVATALRLPLVAFKRPATITECAPRCSQSRWLPSCSSVALRTAARWLRGVLRLVFRWWL